MKSFALSRALVLGGLLVAAPTMAKNAGGLSLLKYSKSTSSTKKDDDKTTVDTTTIATNDPILGLSIYNGNFGLDLTIDPADDAHSTALPSYQLAPSMYLGLHLGYSSTKADTKPSTGDKTTTKSDYMSVGPAFFYRNKSSESLILAGAVFYQTTIKTSTGDSSSSDTKFTVFELSGEYFRKMFDRFYLGAGLAYGKTLSGTLTTKTNDVSTTQDLDVSALQLTLLEMRLDI